MRSGEPSPPFPQRADTEPVPVLVSAAATAPEPVLVCARLICVSCFPDAPCTAIPCNCENNYRFFWAVLRHTLECRKAETGTPPSNTPARPMGRQRVVDMAAGS